MNLRAAFQQGQRLRAVEALEANRHELREMLEAVEAGRAGRPPCLPIPASARIPGQTPEAARPLCARTTPSRPHNPLAPEPPGRLGRWAGPTNRVPRPGRYCM